MKLSSRIALFTGLSMTFAVTVAHADSRPLQPPVVHSPIETARPGERKLYVGANATEATMSFDARVQFTLKPGYDASEEIARYVIEKQVNHLFGPMGKAPYKAVPKNDHTLSNIQIKKLDDSANLYEATYSYTGTVVVQNGIENDYPIVLPVDPFSVYTKSVDAEGVNPQTKKKGVNVCTDLHYQGEGDFWYFWNPEQALPGLKPCSDFLQKDRDYLALNAKFTRRQNTEQTFPEYNRLADANGTITISILMGLNEPEESWNPDQSNDINATNYLQIRQSLQDMGFSNPYRWNTQELAKVYPNAVSDAKLPTVETLEKQDAKAKIVVRLFFGASGINEESHAFHWFYKDALENSSIMMYGGHSGLGGHLDMPSMERIEGFTLTPAPNRYQIYYFNSCTSWTYYNLKYLHKKISADDPKGSKNLDIMANGLETYFSVMGPTITSVARAVDMWASEQGSMTYQNLAREIDSDNLFSIVGDEDNPTVAP